MSVWFYVLVAALLGAGLLDWWARFRHRRRCRRGHQAESRAQRLLLARGYTLVDDQVPARFPMWVDGEAFWVRNRCDRIVRKAAKTFVVEVKTGQGTNPLKTSTRRQLLEYWLCHEVDGVLVVNMDDKTIHQVEFPAAWRPSVGLSIDARAVEPRRWW